MPTFYLPPELWLNVIQSMCYHCTRDPRQPSPVPDHRLHSDLPKSAPLATLARLCRVSKQFRDIATPVLYHCPITTRPELLVRTIFERFHLAENIFEMHANVWQNWPLDLASYPVKFRNAYKKKTYRLRDEKYGIIDEIEFELYDNSLRYGTIEEHVRDTIILEELPRITAVSLETGCRTVCMGIDLDALQNLQFASITNVYDGITDEADLGFCTGLWLHMVAPSLTSMHYRRAIISDELAGFPGSAELTIMELQDCKISASVMPRVLASNPAITTFSYSDAGSVSDAAIECATAREIQNALVKYTPHLKKLHIDLNFANSSYWPPLQECSFNLSLAKLKKLTYLSTDSESLREKEGRTLTEYLVTVLPASLRYLRIRAGESEIGRDQKFRDALVAVAQLRPVVLPAMEKVVIWDEDLLHEEKPDFQRLRDAWARSGVVFEATGVEGPFGCRSF